MLKLVHLIVAVAALGFVARAAVAQADEFTDVIQEVLELYQDGDIAGAKEAMDYAEQLLGQATAAALEGYFPAAMDGWTVEPFEGSMAGAMAFGGGVSVARIYRKGGQSVEISVIGDSPMIQQFGVMFANPAIIESSGGRMVRIKRQNAMITKEGEIQIMVAKRFLISIGGSAEEAVKLEHAKAFDLRGLAKSQ